MAPETFGPSGGSVALTVADAVQHEWSCFADEVAIDFPSPARAIDRMRHAFTGDERAAALPADLRVSWREARDGAVIPLDVPVRCTCRRCGGRGETWAERCGRCAGSGSELLRHTVQVSVPAGVRDGDQFGFTIGTRHDPPTRIELRVCIA
ncbi:MAG: hypothetical protein AB7P99_00215 [Vicinamibacterales bacterium]